MIKLSSTQGDLPAYTRKGTVPVADVLPFILDASTRKIEVLGNSVNVKSLRLMTFATKGVICVSCGCKGSYFAVERAYKAPDTVSFHLNLYAKLDHGEEVLMTRDHIKPRAKDGADTLENSQTMCGPCNEAKSDTYPD